MGKNPLASAGDAAQALVREDPMCLGAAKPLRHDYQALEPRAPRSARREATATRSLRKERALLAAARERPRQQWRPSAAKTHHCSPELVHIPFSEQRDILVPV